MRKGSKQGKRIDGQAVKMTDRRFLDVADEFIKVKESMGLSEQTILTYRWNIKYFVQWAGEDVKYSQLKLNSYLADIDQQAQERLDTIIQQMARAQGVTEALKADDPMAWVGRMNNIQGCAREIVDKKIIYT